MRPRREVPRRQGHLPDRRVSALDVRVPRERRLLRRRRDLHRHGRSVPARSAGSDDARVPCARLASLRTAAAPELSQNATALADFMQAELVSPARYDVVSSADIAALLGIERQRQLMGCNEGSCAVELAGALNAKRALRGTF